MRISMVKRWNIITLKKTDSIKLKSAKKFCRISAGLALEIAHDQPNRSDEVTGAHTTIYPSYLHTNKTPIKQ